MALRQVVLSDISGEELTDANHARVTVKHPDQSSWLELDLSSAEAAKLVETTLRLVEFHITEPGKPARTVRVETKTLDKLFEKGFDEILSGARKSIASPGPAKKASSNTAKADRLDYSSPEHAGKLHRGRITEAEAEWVRKNKAQASKNRGTAIDWDDPVEIKRYGL